MSSLTIGITVLAAAIVGGTWLAGRRARAFMQDKRKRRRGVHGSHQPVRMPDPAPHGRRSRKR